MRKKIFVAATLLFFAIGSALVVLNIRESISIRDTSSTIELLKGKIQGGKEPQEIYQIIVELLGQPDRETGSGIQTLHWDLPSGELIYPYPSTAVIFLDTKGKATWLIDTKHEAGPSIVGSYEMTSPPDNSGTRYWLGDLGLRADGTYEFIDSNTSRNERQKQEDNFFINNPKGTYAVGFYKGVTVTTLLEKLADNIAIAELKFTARDEFSNTLYSESFSIYIDAGRRVLNFKTAADKNGIYQLEKSWTNYSETQ